MSDELARSFFEAGRLAPWVAGGGMAIAIMGWIAGARTAASRVLWCLAASTGLATVFGFFSAVAANRQSIGEDMLGGARWFGIAFFIALAGSGGSSILVTFLPAISRNDRGHTKETVEK